MDNIPPPTHTQLKIPLIVIFGSHNTTHIKFFKSYWKCITNSERQCFWPPKISIVIIQMKFEKKKINIPKIETEHSKHAKHCFLVQSSEWQECYPQFGCGKNFKWTKKVMVALEKDQISMRGKSFLFAWSSRVCTTEPRSPSMEWNVILYFLLKLLTFRKNH